MTILEAKKMCFFHPLKFVFLDDNLSFLHALELEFGDQINMLTFTNPDEALTAINSSGSISTQSTFKFINNINADTSSDHSLGFEITNMLHVIYDKSRFARVGVVIVDYEMPNTNGVEFCQSLKDKNLFKIMLTAEADKDTAINAFNTGAIDKFILKTSPHLYQELISAMNELTQRYFKELSRPIIDSYGNFIKPLFDNQLYQQLFNQLLLTTEAVEYYLVDNYGSFLFLDKNANPTWLMVRHTNELNEQLKLLQGYEIPNQLLSAIAQKEKILFLLSEDDYKKPAEEWVHYIFESTALDNDYYYSIVKGHLTDSIQWEKVIPYLNSTN